MTPAWLIGVLIAATCTFSGLFYTYRTGYVNGAQSVQAAWDTEKAAAAIEAQQLQANMDKLRGEKNHELARLNATVRSLSDSLRRRPERPASATQTANVGNGASGCTGATVYKQDGEFLIGEATRADQLRLALIACQSAYLAASKQLNN